MNLFKLVKDANGELFFNEENKVFIKDLKLKTPLKQITLEEGSSIQISEGALSKLKKEYKEGKPYDCIIFESHTFPLFLNITNNDQQNENDFIIVMDVERKIENVSLNIFIEDGAIIQNKIEFKSFLEKEFEGFNNPNRENLINNLLNTGKNEKLKNIALETKSFCLNLNVELYLSGILGGTFFQEFLSYSLIDIDKVTKKNVLGSFEGTQHIFGVSQMSYKNELAIDVSSEIVKQEIITSGMKLLSKRK